MFYAAVSVPQSDKENKDIFMEKDEKGMPVYNAPCSPDGDEVMYAPSLAMVYSPVQRWRKLYSPDEALAHGTMFEELYKPLEIMRGCSHE